MYIMYKNVHVGDINIGA